MVSGFGWVTSRFSGGEGEVIVRVMRDVNIATLMNLICRDMEGKEAGVR